MVLRQGTVALGKSREKWVWGKLDREALSPEWSEGPESRCAMPHSGNFRDSQVRQIGITFDARGIGPRNAGEKE